MRPFWSRFIRHAFLVGSSLAVVGFILGKAFLIAHRMYSGTAYNPENERVLWQTPLVMALLGISMTAFLDLAIGMFRKPVPVAVDAGNRATPMG
jgi:uncharacterized membrane protein YhhN